METEDSHMAYSVVFVWSVPDARYQWLAGLAFMAEANICPNRRLYELSFSDWPESEERD